MPESDIYELLDNLQYEDQGGGMDDVEYYLQDESYGARHNHGSHSANNHQERSYHGRNLNGTNHIELHNAGSGSDAASQYRAGQSQYHEQAIHHSRVQPDRPNQTQSRITHQHQGGNGNGLVQSIKLISTRQLPSSYQSVFPFVNFNAIQSDCFEAVYNSDDNFVLSSPTGSGKTVIFELAICHLLSTQDVGNYKIVYQAPTKSLCTERQRDWQRKFEPLGLKCAQFTGDSEKTSLAQISSAHIIITTPEKWDSMTRRWKDQKKLIKLIKLFMIDEVHMLKDERGATLEAVVSRMKSIDSDVRFIALSATIPNAEDIAQWLGLSPRAHNMPAQLKQFGENFRPVRLQKYVCGYEGGSNMFSLDAKMTKDLENVIRTYSLKKPIMVFCCTKKIAENTAIKLAEMWNSARSQERYWNGPSSDFSIRNPKLKDCVAAGVAYHHAGLDGQDRNTVEQRYIKGDINVICCTSTLAVGVNLPCHFVIIKGTQKWTETGAEELSSLEALQMLGRAGRPQFDTSAIAVIMTQARSVKRWERMVSGDEILESCLHKNLIEHLNSEIGLGTIIDRRSAKIWLQSTFLAVRLRKNPQYYNIEGTGNVHDVNQLVTRICDQNIEKLQEAELLTPQDRFESTAYGFAMASYFIKFETMKTFLGLSTQNSKLSEMISAIAHADELKEFRFREGEKEVFKQINTGSHIKFPIPVGLTTPAHKISLLIQTTLSCIDLGFAKNQRNMQEQHRSERKLVLSKIKRFICCIVDVTIARGDSVTLKTALMFLRSIAAKGWEDKFQCKYVDLLDDRMVRSLLSAGISSLETLEYAEQHQIESACKQAPPFGRKVLDIVRSIPKLRVSLSMKGNARIEAGKGATVNMKAEVGFMNEHITVTNGTKVYVVFVAETSDGQLLHFARNDATKFKPGLEILFEAKLVSHLQHIVCHVMCDEIVGSVRSATLRPTIPSLAWPAAQFRSECTNVVAKTTATKKKSAVAPSQEVANFDSSDEFGLGDDDDAALMEAADGMRREDEFVHVDDIDTTFTRTRNQSSTQRVGQLLSQRLDDQGQQEPVKLPNGKYRCHHRCKDKRKCNHLCCRQGMEKPPRQSKPSQKQVEKQKMITSTQLEAPSRTKAVPKTQINLLRNTSAIRSLDLTNEPIEQKVKAPAQRALEQLQMKAGGSLSNATSSKARYEIQDRGTDEPFQVPEFDDEEQDDIFDADDPTDYMLTGETFHQSRDSGQLVSEESLPEIDVLVTRKGLERDKHTEAKSRHITDDEFDDVIDWQAIDPIIKDVQNDNSRHEDEQSSSSLEPATVKQTAKGNRTAMAIITPAYDTRKRTAQIQFTSPLFVQPTSKSPLRETSNVQPSPAKKLKTIAMADHDLVQNTVNMISEESAAKASENKENEISRDKKAEIEAWFMEEFGHCAVLVDSVD